MPTRALGYLFILAVVGALVVAYPPAMLVISLSYAVFAVLASFLRRAAGIGFWQVLVYVTLSGYIVLNYGFANLAFRVAGVPLIVGHTLMFTALALAVLSNPERLFIALREPAMLCVSVLILLACIHLAYDVPRYGLYAVRDSSVFLEGIFLLLGLWWVRSKRAASVLMKLLFCLFLLNLLYSFSYFWAGSLSAWSPKSGIFRFVPVMGFYAHNYVYLLAGALFCLWVAPETIKWPGWVLLLLAVLQLFGLAIHQARSMYVGILVLPVVLLVLTEFRRLAKLTLTVFLGLGVLLLVTSLLPFDLPGRVGPTKVDFLKEHARSLLLERGTPALGTIYHRWQWYKQVWERSRSSTTNLIFGEGFGKPLIEFQGRGGVAVRQPHNTHLTVLARLGLVGLAFWTLFHLSIISRFLHTLLWRRHTDKSLSGLVLWLFCFYLLSMIATTVQPHLEFSYGAIPFYFLMGVALDIMPRQFESSVLANNNRTHRANHC